MSTERRRLNVSAVALVLLAFLAVAALAGETVDPVMGERVTEEVWNKGRIETLGEYYAEDVVRHTPERPEPIVGLDANKAYIAETRRAFPDLHVELDRQVSQDDWVAVMWRWSGTHEGDLPGLPATGRKVVMTGMSFLHIVDGLAVEIWDESNILAMMQQFGVIPPPPEPPPPTD